MNLDVHVIREKTLTVLVTSFFVLFVVTLPRYIDFAKNWFVLLCLTALVYLVFNFKRVKDTSYPECLLFAAIISVCMAYIVGCFAEDHFEGKSATMFVSVFLALLLARISAGKPKQDSDSHP